MMIVSELFIRRIEGLWHNHVVQRGQAGASVPRIAWQFVRTRVLVASFIYLLGMIISLCSPVNHSILCLHLPRPSTVREKRVTFLCNHYQVW